jgi:hypothetical protein
MHIRAAAGLPKECRGAFRVDEARIHQNQGSVAAPQAIAGLQEQAPHATKPDLSCHIGALPDG